MQPLILLLIFAPGMAAAQKYQTIIKEPLSLARFICITGEFCLFNLLFNYLFLMLRHWNDNPFQLLTIQFTFKYVLLSLIYSNIFPYLYKLGKYLFERYITGSH